MTVSEQFLGSLPRAQREMMLGLDTPRRIQDYLDSIPYSTEETNRCPHSVLRDGVAHCLDGALLAAAALRQIGYPPLVLDMLPEPGTDDDHVLAVYRRGSFYGTLAKSNFVGLRYREPVYRTLRELVLSYFEFFFNVSGEKTLRAYTPLYDLSHLDSSDWLRDDRGADAVERTLCRLRKYPLFPPETVAVLSQMDERTYAGGTLGTDPAGLYQPHKSASI